MGKHEGKVEVKPYLKGRLWRAFGRVDVEHRSSSLSFDIRAVYSVEGKFKGWQSVARRKAWGRSKQSAIANCRHKLCEVVKRDQRYLAKDEEKDRLRQKRTITFDNPCEPTIKI